MTSTPSIIKPGIPLPATYGGTFSHLDIAERIEQGRIFEWRLLEVLYHRWRAEGKAVTLQRVTTKEDIGGTDGIFVVNGVSKSHQSKTRERGFADIGTEICRYFYDLISDLDRSPGRDMKPYDHFDCLTWTPNDSAILNVVDGAHHKGLLTTLIAEWKAFVREYRGFPKPFVSERLPGAIIHTVKDPNDKHAKLIAYLAPSLFAGFVQQYVLTLEELAYIYEGIMPTKWERLGGR
jgi:hypothetical protein